MKAFVTGADGFIGSHLCELLRDEGYSVTGLAHYNSFDSFGWLDEIEGVEKVLGDVRDTENMLRLIHGHEIVFHLAALIAIPDSYDRPRSYVDTNVTGTLNVLMAARATAAKVVHTSTSEVYGTAQYTPMDEKHLLNPQSPYAASKAAADALANSFRLSYGLPIVTLRPFNTYGPRQSERAVIARIIRQELDPDQKSIVLGNLSPERDFTYVTDTARAFLAASRLDSGLFNAGSGKAISIQKLADKVATKPIKSTSDRYRPAASEVDRLQCDAAALVTAADWRPTVSLDEGLLRTMAWRRSRNFRKDLGKVA